MNFREDVKNMKKHNGIIIGGSFDHFHLGHIRFLETAISKSKKLYVGITSDEFVKNKNFNGSIERFSSRKKAVENFLKNKTKFELFKLDDKYGPSLEIKNANAILVTESNIETAEEINLKRKEKGYSGLSIIIQSMIESDDGKFISSERIRKGEIDRAGKALINNQWFDNNYLLPDKIRKKLKKPFGKLMQKPCLVKMPFATVGDVTTFKFNKLNIIPSLSVIDLKVKRKRKFKSVKDLKVPDGIYIKKVVSSQGTISSSLFQAVNSFFSSNKRTVIQIEGEDDLAVIPIILIAPLDFHLFYGQPGEGIVAVKVTEQLKKRTLKLIESFSTRGY